VEVTIDCEDKVASLLYREIVKDILQSYVLSIDKIHIFVDIKEPIFIILIRWGETAKIEFEENTIVKRHAEGVKVTVRDESSHLAKQILGALKTIYGENAIAKDENEMVIKDAKPQDLKKITISGSENIIKKATDILIRIAPEGFRVAHILSDNDSLTLISSENPIDSKWVEKAKQIQKHL